MCDSKYNYSEFVIFWSTSQTSEVKSWWPNKAFYPNHNSHTHEVIQGEG